MGRPITHLIPPHPTPPFSCSRAQLFSQDFYPSRNKLNHVHDLTCVMSARAKECKEQLTYQHHSRMHRRVPKQQQVTRSQKVAGFQSGLALSWLESKAATLSPGSITEDSAYQSKCSLRFCTSRDKASLHPQTWLSLLLNAQAGVVGMATTACILALNSSQPRGL